MTTESHERVAQQHQPNMPRIGREALSHARQPLRRGPVNPPRPENMSMRPMRTVDVPTDRIDTDGLNQMVNADPQTEIMRPVASRPTANNEHERTGTPRWIKYGGGALIGVIAAAGIGGVAYGLGGKGEAKGPSDTDRSTSVSYNPADIDHNGYVSEIEKAKADGVVTKDELDSLSDPAQAEGVKAIDLTTAYAEDFDAWRPQTYHYISTLLTTEQKDVLQQGQFPATPKAEWSHQDILNQITLDVADTTIQDTPGLGQLMLPTVLNPKTPGYSGVSNNAKGGESKPNPTIAVYKADDTLYPQPKGSFMNIEGLSENAKLISGTYIENGTGKDGEATPKIGILVDLVKSPDGKSENWRKVGFWDSNDPIFQAAVADLR